MQWWTHIMYLGFPEREEAIVPFFCFFVLRLESGVNYSSS